MKKHFYHRHDSQRSGYGFGIGLLSAIAGAGATYYLFGTEKGAKQREKAKEWAYEAKDKIVKTGDELRDTAAQAYSNLKSTLKDRYEDLDTLDETQRKVLAAKIKAHWELIKDDIEDAIRQSKKIIEPEKLE